MTDELLKGPEAKCANKVQDVQEKVNSLKSEFSTTVKKLDHELSATNTTVYSMYTEVNFTSQNVSRIEKQIRDLQTGPADSIYNFSHQVPVDSKVIRKNAKVGWSNFNHHSLGAVYHY